MNFLFYLVSFFVIFAVTGCATPVYKSGTDFKTETLNNIVIGHTTKVEVIGVLGAPKEMRERVLDNTKYDISIYLFSQLEEGFFNSKSLTCEFKNNVLNAYKFESSFKEDQPEITEKERVHLEKGETTRNNVQNLFGSPSSKAFFPTTIASGYIPPGTKEIWEYSYKELSWTMRGYTNKINKSLTRSITIFFDSNGTVIDSRHFIDTLKGTTD